MITGGTRQRVLLVDDVKFFLELERSFLDREGFEVLTAENGRDAIELARRERPAIVLLDLYMPEMSGEEVCRVLKQDPALRTIPVIIVTSGQKEEDLRRCTAAGCDGILRKPLSRVEMVETIGRFLKTRTRTASRVPIRVPVTLAPEAGPAAAPRLLTATTVDVSIGGLYVEMPDPLPAGTTVGVEFTLPEFGVPIRANAVVAWVNRPAGKSKGALPAGTGLRFTDLSAGVKGILEMFIARALAARRGRS